MSENKEETVGIMKLIPGKLAPLVIVVGDPGRAEQFSSHLEDCEVIGDNREYKTFTGTYKGKKVSISSHGVGGGGASMAFEELIKNGAKVIIRAGTAGSFRHDLREGSMLIATGAVRSDGVSDGLVPKEFPAVADHTVVSSLVESVKQYPDQTYGVGIVTTEGIFYDGPLGNKNKLWEGCGVLGVEMEVSVLMVIGSIRGIKTGSILNVDNYVFERLIDGKYLPHREVVAEGTKKMAIYALDAIVKVPLD